MDNVHSHKDRRKDKEIMSTKKFIIPCYWNVYGNVEVEAETVEEAVMILEDGPLPENGSYVANSFRVDHEVINSYNDEEEGS